jgi:tetratricopeptide (TPR) repeat protein
VKWITNENSTSQVNYYDGQSTNIKIDEIFVTEHSIEINGLEPAKTYQITIKSTNTQGKETIYKYENPIIVPSMAESDITKSILSTSQQVKKLISEGDALLQKFDYTEAMKCYDAAIALDTNNTIAWCRKGDTFFKQAQVANSKFIYQKAIDCYIQSVNLDGNNYKAWAGWGNALNRKDPY